MFVIQSDDTTSDASSWDLLGEVPSVIAGLPPAPTPAPSSQSPRPTSAPAGGSTGSASGGSDEVLDGASIGLLVGVVFLAAAVAGGAFYYRLSKRATGPAPVVELARRCSVLHPVRSSARLRRGLLHFVRDALRRREARRDSSADSGFAPRASSFRLYIYDLGSLLICRSLADALPFHRTSYYE